MIITFYLTVKPTSYNGKITWTASASVQKPAVGTSMTTGAKILKVNLDVPDDELEVPEITIPWPSKVTTPTPDMVAEVKDWMK